MKSKMTLHRVVIAASALLLGAHASLISPAAAASAAKYMISAANPQASRAGVETAIERDVATSRNLQLRCAIVNRPNTG